MLKLLTFIALINNIYCKNIILSNNFCKKDKDCLSLGSSYKCVLVTTETADNDNIYKCINTNIRQLKDGGDNNGSDDSSNHSGSHNSGSDDSSNHSGSHNSNHHSGSHNSSNHSGSHNSGSSNTQLNLKRSNSNYYYLSEILLLFNILVLLY